MNKLILAYTAGLFDGEGFVRIDSHHKNISTGRTPANTRFCLHVGVAMTYMPAIKLLHERFGGHYRGDDSFQKRYSKNRVIYRWNATSVKAYDFLVAIQPYSVVKREQIDIAIKFQKHVFRYKGRMLGYWKNSKGLAKQEALKAKVFAVRAVLCDRIRDLKKEDFPLSHE